MSQEDSRTEYKDPRSPAPNTVRSGQGRKLEQGPPVSQVGRYILLKQLGQGGMGVVYAAYDPDLDRKVALKLLRTDTQTDSEDARARLLREAQALARVSHPNVIPIFDVGVWGDQVFLTMELVDGGTLHSWGKEAPRSWHEVLERFLAAGRGLLAAHEAGLVHRDFKPANVLVSRAGRVYVTDFGLARHVGRLEQEDPLPQEAQPLLPPDHRLLASPLTEAGLVLGTPSYMSPEQFRGGEVDARSDQFSFCVALYWALYNQRAFDPERMEKFVASKLQPEHAGPTQTLEPQNLPTASTPEVPKDLILEPPRDSKVPAWVRQAVMRGLSLTPEARFASMKELLEALSQEQRRAKRWRWGLAACAAGVGLAVVAGGVYRQAHLCSNAGARMDQVWGPAAQQKLEAAFLATGRPFAKETASRVVQVLEGYAADWKRQSTEACEATRVRGEQPEALLVKRVVCLERRRKDMRAAVELLGGADAALVEKALDAVHSLPSLQECEDVESLSEQQQLPSDPARRADIEQLEGRLAEVKAQVDAGRYPSALEVARQLEAPVLATGHLPLIAELRFHLGWLQEQLGKDAEAAELLSQAVYDAEGARTDRLKVSILNKLLFVEDGQQHFPQATSWGRLAEATIRRIGGDPVLESDVRVNEANLAVSQSHLPEARALLEQARALQDKALAPGHPKRARTTFLLGRVLLDMGERPRAVEVLEEALKQTEASVGAQHPDMARRHGLLSLALREMKDYARALEHARATADIRKAIFGASSIPFAESLDEEGMCLLGLGRYDEALHVYEESLAIKRQALPAGDKKLQFSYDGVGQALLGLGRARESLEPLRQAVSFTSVSADVLAESGFALARALWLSGSPEDARREAAQARQRFTQAGLTERTTEVDAWLASLSKPPSSPPGH